MQKITKDPFLRFSSSFHMCEPPSLHGLLIFECECHYHYMKLLYLSFVVVTIVPPLHPFFAFVIYLLRCDERDSLCFLCVFMIAFVFETNMLFVFMSRYCIFVVEFCTFPNHGSFILLHCYPLFTLPGS